MLLAAILALTTDYLVQAQLQNTIGNNSSQNVNSTNSVRLTPGQLEVIGSIFGVLWLVGLIIAILRTRIRKSKLRAGLGISIVLLSGAIYLYYNDSYGTQAISFVPLLIAFAIILIGRKKKIPWKMREKPRRYFSSNVREQVLKNQKYRCAGCDNSLSKTLVEFDHVNGDPSDNDISNCQALCPNCHSQKTDEDRRKQ